MISNTYKIELPYASVFKESWCLVDIETEGRFWRTSRLLAARVITYGSPLEEYEWIAECESDEYDILSELAQVLMRSSCIMTFNGDSFDLPHLRKKYQAYRAQDPTKGKKTLDLMRALMPYKFMFELQSYRLADYLSLFHGKYDIRNDAEGALLVSSLLELSNLFTLPDTSCEAGMLEQEGESKKIFRAKWKTPDEMPIEIEIFDEVFHLTSCGSYVRLEITCDGSVLRRYYIDYENYDFLLAEGYAAHRSLTAYVAADRKEKAVRTNCFSLIPVSSVFPDRPDRLKKYIQSVLVYMKRGIDRPFDIEDPV
ncbi:MAG: ribonuclease H-like domain-containing protein [Lachnospiraceae bacterium]|nr:ribonuclease H-like domain-containing protein [Lachnospiraceae bacterium]